MGSFIKGDISPEAEVAAIHALFEQLGAAEARFGLDLSPRLTNQQVRRLTVMHSVLMARVQSPIEAMLGTHLLFVPFHDDYEAACKAASVVPQFRLECQMPIDRYRVDFLVTLKVGENALHTVIECDGHDFHERTKEQAARDRNRDRELLALGYPTLRFTGSEIHKDVWGCYAQAARYFAGKVAPFAKAA